ncbi:MAG: hypothetical protein JJT78_03215 [Leptospira sp.]|nr:hypothetical protein [Leptospira sp.]
MNTKISILSATFMIVSLCNCHKEESVCPSIYIAPHAKFQFSKPLSKVGTYQIKIEEPIQETCTLQLISIEPEKILGDVVESPSTSYEMNCKSLAVGGLTSKGTISGFHSGGIRENWKWEMRLDGKLITSWKGILNYKNFSCPDRTIAEVTLEMID